MSLYEEITGKKKKKEEQTTQRKKIEIPSWNYENNNVAPVKKSIISEDTKQKVQNTLNGLLDKTFGISKVKDTWSNGYQIGDVSKTILDVTSGLNPISSITNKGTEIGTGVASDLITGKGDYVKNSKSLNNIADIWSNGYQVGDVLRTHDEISKTILGTTADVVANLAKGELQTAEGLVDTGRYVVSDVAKGYGLDNYSKDVKKRAVQNTTGFIFGENDENNKPIENGWLKKLDAYSLAGDKLDQIVNSVGQQAFRIGLSNAIGTAGSKLGASAEQVSAIEKGFNKLEIFAGSYGSAKSEALMNGASDKDATIRGIISGTSEYISENMFDSVPGFKTGELGIATKFKNIIGNSAEQAFGQKGGQVILRIFGATSEGIEEGISNALETAFTDIANCIDENYTYGMKEGQGATGDTFGEKAFKLFQDTFGSGFSEESKEAFVSAFFSTLITGAFTDGMTESQRKEVIKAYAEDNNISVDKATQLFDGIRDLRVEDVTDKTTSFEDKVNIRNQATQQLAEQIKEGNKTGNKINLEEMQEAYIAKDKLMEAVGTGAVTSKGLDLVDSYKSYKGDDGHIAEIREIQNMINKRNVDARFDATAFNNSSENSKWITENGKESVLFNPKASANEVIQDLAVHEMSHDIFAQKTASGKELYKDVLEHAKSDKDYQKMRTELEDLYAEYYDRNSKDFAKKIDEEVVAKYLGKNLGTQEYISRLVNEKPNLATRMYNWVKEKLSNIGQSKETIQERKYWKAVADKFEKAYNEQKKELKTNETAYSISPKGEMVDSKGNKVTLEASEVETNIPIRDDAKLMAIHNLGEDKLNGVLDLGGFPVPSIAITDPSKVNHSQFGNISILFNKSTIDPSYRRNEVYDRDVWTPTFPRVEYDLNMENIRKMSKENKIYDNYDDDIVSHVRTNYFYGDNLNDLVDRNGIDGALERMKQDKELKYLYQKTLDNDYQPQMKPTKYNNEFDNSTLQEYVDLYNSNKFNDMSLPDFYYHYLNYGDMDLTEDQTKALKATIRDIIYKEYRKEAQEEYNKAIQRDASSVKQSEDAFIDNYVNMMLESYDKSYFKYKDFIKDASRLDEFGETMSVDQDATLNKVNEEVNQEDFNNWIDNTFGKLLKETKKGIRNDKDIFTASGNRRSFNQLHEEYNLRNIVDYITSKNTVAGEEGFGSGQNFGTFQAKLSNRFNSIEDIKNAQDRLQFNEETKELLDNYSSQVYEYMNELGDYSYNKNRDYYYGDNAGYALNDFAGYKNHNEANLNKALENNGIDSKAVPQELKNNIIKTTNELKNIPTDYFEAKPQRAVGLDEIQMAVIPNNTSQELKQRLQEKGVKYAEYDTSIEGDRNRVVNQFSDLKFDISNQNNEIAPVTPGTRTTIGQMFNENVAPLREDLQELTQQIEDLSKQIETLQNGAENGVNEGYIAPIRDNYTATGTPLTAEEADLYQNALMNDEAYLSSLNKEAENYIEKNEIDNQTAKRITNKVASMLSIPTKQTAQLEEIVRKAVKNEWTTDEIANELSRNYAWQKDISPNDEIIQAKKIIRDIPIKVSDSIKKNITDYGDFQKKHFGKIHFANYGSPVDSVYQELTSTLPGLFSTDILNDTDQLLRIAEVVDKSSEYVEEYQLPPEYIDNVADYINEELLLDKINTQTEGDRLLQNKINYGVEDAEPVSILSQNTIDDFIENRDIAPVRQTKAKTPKQVQRENAIRRLQEMFVNKFAELDKLSQATQNSEITAKGSKWENASGQARNDIDRKQTNNRGEVIGKGVKEIWQPIKDAGMYEVVNDYLIQKSNIERHAVGKGSEIPLEISKQLVNRYETEYPNIKELVQPIYTYFDNVLQNQVDAGLISQDKYKDYRGETGIYRSYVPFYPGEVDRNRYYDNEGRLKAVSTLKRSKGNAGDTNRILAIEDSMIKQTYGYKNSIDFNELAQQIVSTSKASDTDIMDFIETNPYDMSTSLQTDAEGTKYLTAYFDGKPTTIEISNELYNELSRENENRIKQFEEDFSMITNPLQRLSSIRRDLLTTKNPVFLIRNVIKDVQDAVINSKHTALMLKNYLPGLKELAQGNTKEAQQFLALYGTEGTYGNYESVGKTGLLNRIAQANELLELAPRFAEFKASLQSGESVDQAMYNAREVTTNFSRGGYVTKALNRNGFTFLNANVQGLDKIVRNLSGQNGVKGVTAVVTKGVLAGVIPAILNHMLYGSGDDKDEDYEALPDYIKDNYYLIKLENGEFLRIPKGRVISVIGSGARRTIEALEGEENAFDGYLENAWSQIGVGDSGGLQTIFTPIQQAFGSKNGTAWYGGDIVPTRLQDKPAGEQTDANIDAISNFIGSNLNISPYKINYVLDQYSGGIGDIVLPYLTPATTNGAEGAEGLVAPLKDAFVINSTDDNKYAGEFYDTKDKLQIQSNSSKATDEDILKYKYMSNVSTELSELYKNKRDVQADTTLTKSEKYAQVQEIQKQINSLTKEAMDNYKNVTLTDNYAEIGGIEYHTTEDGWRKVNDKDTENTAGMTTTEKEAYYNTKLKTSGYIKEYNAQVKDLDKDNPLRDKYNDQKKEGIMRAVSSSGLSNQDKANLYISALGKDEDTMNQMVNAGYNIDTYVQATYDIDNLRDKYSQKKGYTTAQRKAKTIAYINSLDMNIPQKAMLIRQYYTSYREYNNQIVNYVANLDISYEEKIEILKGNGMKVDSKGRVKW